MVEQHIGTNTINALKVTVALLFFALGGCIYIAFRSTSLRMFGWFDHLGMHDFIMGIRYLTSEIQVPAFIRYSIPDGLWTLSYILLMDVIWAPDLRKRILFGSIIPVVGGFSEILQCFHIVKGTFDIIDLLCYLVPYIVYQLKTKL